MFEKSYVFTRGRIQTLFPNSLMLLCVLTADVIMANDVPASQPDTFGM